MTVPRADEYQAAIQSPRLAFADLDLSQSQVQTDILGLPRVASGGFVLTYRLDVPGRSWAVRCFHREVPDLQRRYQAISDFFVTHPAPMFVPVTYVSDGIRVSGRFYPIIKMPWIQGEPLGAFVDSHVQSPTHIQPLADRFRAVIKNLGRLGVAHGDLQHGNIVVENGQIRLIDYDGFFVPKLKGLEAGDLGHVNYQHPRRQPSQFGPELDRFSSIVIYLGLRSTALQPGLWQTYATGENILFSQKDFLDPEHSRLLQDLARIPQVQPYVQPFRQVCLGDLGDVPLLEDFVAGRVRSSLTSPTPRVTAPRHQYPRIDATDVEQLRHYQGQRVEVVGIITDVATNRTQPGGRSFVFLNFGSSRAGCFRLVLWDHAFLQFQQTGLSPESLVGETVVATGVVAVYGDLPQIVISFPSEIQRQQQPSPPGGAPRVPVWATPPVALPLPTRSKHSAAPVGSTARTKSQTRQAASPPQSSVDDTLSALYGGQSTALPPKHSTSLPPAGKPASPKKARPAGSTGPRSRKKPAPPVPPTLGELAVRYVGKLIDDLWRKIG